MTQKNHKKALAAEQKSLIFLSMVFRKNSFGLET